MFKHPIVLLVVFFAIIGILIATKQVSTPKIFLPKANVIGVSLSIVPSKLTLEFGQESILDIALDPAGDEVSAIELAITYDPSIIEVTDLQPSTALPQSLGKDISQTGKAQIILLTTPGATQIPSGVVAKIYIKALKGGNTSLKFDSSTKVTAIGKTGDVLGGIEPSEITVIADTINRGSTPNSQPEGRTNTNAADDLIEKYLNIQTESSESSQSGGLFTRYSKIASDYFKGIISSINQQAETQARKFLD